MKTDPKTYRRLPGRGGNLIGYHSLWAGPDHLLGVFESLSTESYRRFYYRDIQAMVIRRTASGRVINGLLAVLTLLFLLPAAGKGFPGPSAGVIAGGTALLLLMINWLRGPTCTCHMQTAVQIEKLPSLNRIRTVRKALARLQPRIESIQGRLTADTLEGRLSAAAAADEPVRVRREPARPQRVVSPTLHIWLFGLLVGYGLVSAAEGVLSHPLPSLLSILLFAATVLLLIAALIRQSGSTLAGGLKTTTWLTLAFTAVSFVAANAMFLFLVISNPRALTMNQWQMFSYFARLSPLQHPILLAGYLFSICTSLALGVAGLWYLRRVSSGVESENGDE